MIEYLHNVSEVFPSQTGEGFTWSKFPRSLEGQLENGRLSMEASRSSLGVELRFKIQGDKAVLRLAKEQNDDVTASFHVFFGDFQGFFTDHEKHRLISYDVDTYVIEKPKIMEDLKRIANEEHHAFSPEVVRIIFDRSVHRIISIEGAIPPKKEDFPKDTILFYGSSITAGYNAIDMSHTFPSWIGHALHQDVLNYGCCGACYAEPCVATYLASLGKTRSISKMVLELGVNVIDWEEAFLTERSKKFVETIAKENPQTDLYIVSPYYHPDDFYLDGKHANRWRRVLKGLVDTWNNPRIHYISGLDLLPSISYLSADLIHPSIYGEQHIAEELLKRIQNKTD